MPFSTFSCPALNFPILNLLYSGELFYNKLFLPLSNHHTFLPSTLHFHNYNHSAT